MRHEQIRHEPAVEKKYILYRLESDGRNIVIEAGPKAPSAIGIKDFKTFIAKYGFSPLEVAQFLKISHDDIKLLVDHQSWIEHHAQDNLIRLFNLASADCRHEICKFLMVQEGNVGGKNVPIRGIDLPDGH